jgi:conjugative relaxase-like TrwC/TraI family protein
VHRGCIGGGPSAVLTIGKLGASVDQLGYYEQQVAQGLEDYFSGRGEAPGRWAGAGARLVRVSGRVDREAFMRAMAGCDPRTGERLKPEHGRTKVAAFDLTFSAPKSVSVLFAIADERTSAALLDAHRHAVAAAFAYVEREACFTRRGRNGVDRVRGDGFLAAAYRHRLSRAGDPQLHTHVVVANMTRADGRWTSLEAHGLYEHKSAAGALYRAVLRAEVRERLPWVWWRSSGRGLFEIDGVPAGVLREFSRRRVEIEERARELTGVAASQLSRERMQGIALATRKAKEYKVDGARWQQEARARAAEHGLGPAEIRDLEAWPVRDGGRPVGDLVAGAAGRLSGPEGLTGQHNTFARRHALAELAGEFTQGATTAQVQDATSGYLEHETVVGLGRIDAEPRFTTRDLLAREQAIVDSAKRRITEQAGLLHARVADLVLVQQPGQLTDEQSAAVRALAGDGQGVSALQALAGTGKTRVLATLARVYEAGGYRVVGVAPTGRAARELADTAAVPASTVQRLVADLEESGGFAGRTVVLFDEAGTAPTRPSASLFTAAERGGVKIIAVGDSGQLPSVAAGGWFGTLTRSLDGPELRQVMRQHDPAERDALEHLHDGDPDPYLSLKRDRGDLQVHDREDDAIAATLAGWDEARRGYGLFQAVMIARDNRTRAILNDHARQLLAHAGQLTGPAVAIADQEFQVGDRVIARRNDRYRDIDNGTLATITHIDHHTATLTLTTDAGHDGVLDASYAAEHLEHAYALTGHGAQGATITSATVIGRPSEFTREWAYTALTRARRETSIYVVAESTSGQRQREQYAPPEPQRTEAEALDILNYAMRRRESEPLALEQQPPANMRTTTPAPAWRTPLVDFPEAGADPASSAHPDAQATASDQTARREPDWGAVNDRRARGHGHDHGRER